MFVDPKVEVREFNSDFLAAVLELDFRVEKEPIVEAVPGVENGAEQVDTSVLAEVGTALIRRSPLLKEHFSVARERHAGRPLIDGRSLRSEAERLPLVLCQLLTGFRLSAPQPFDFGREQVETSLQLFR